MRYDIPVEPKAGAFGATAVVLFGALYIVIAFAALYMWLDADAQLAAALAVASIVIPMTPGFFVSELVHQRAGALCFVLVAAGLTGAIAAWAVAEQEDFQERQEAYDLVAVTESAP